MRGSACGDGGWTFNYMFILSSRSSSYSLLSYSRNFYTLIMIDNHPPYISLQLQWFLDEFKNVLVIGDFNQLENGNDKLGGSTKIRGLEAFLDWRFRSNASEVPFSGPRFTWSNKREGNDLILESLDRAYITEEWFNECPNGKIIHEPIVCSDHAAITYYEQVIQSPSTRPYQVKNWCLGFREIQEMVKMVWKEEVHGSAMYQVSRKLESLRTKLQHWCLDNKKVWGINWRKITTDLLDSGLKVTSLQEGDGYIQHINQAIPINQMYYNFWRQRMKVHWIKFGDCPTTTMYRRVKQRQAQNSILTLRNEEGTWVEDQKEVDEMILRSIKEVYNPESRDEHGEEIDLLLRQLDIPFISDEDREWLSKDFTDDELRRQCLAFTGPNPQVQMVPHHISHAAPHFVHGVDLHEGEHGKVGSTHTWNYTLAGKPQKAKSVLKEVDEEKKYVKYQVIEGDLLDDYKTFYGASQVIPKDEESNIVKWTLEYEKKHPDVPEPSALLDSWLDAIKHVDDHHHGQK